MFKGEESQVGVSIVIYFGKKNLEKNNENISKSKFFFFNFYSVSSTVITECTLYHFQVC